jgi:beta-lactamase superfamily II metal-dependent hydrolase
MLVYGDTSFLFTGDSPQAIEKYLVSLDGTRLKSDVLKVGHHGSKTSSASVFVGYVSPQYAVLSRGCANSYGHPHQEVLDTFARFEIEMLDTCKEGTITFVSDGTTVRLR